MVINGIKLEDLDANDYDTAKKVEVELVKIKDIEKKVSGLNQSELIKVTSDYINNFFDNVFGEGTSEKLFKGKKNLVTSIKAMEDFYKNYNESKSAIDDILKKYSPNRATRRSKK